MEKRIDNLLSQMTLDERLIVWERGMEYRVSAFQSFGSSEGIHGLQRRGRWQAERAAIHYDLQFPQPLGMGESWRPELVRQASAALKDAGAFITQTEKYNRQVPMLWGRERTCTRPACWGRSEGVYGEDPFFNGTMIVAFYEGVAGDDQWCDRQRCSKLAASRTVTRCSALAPLRTSISACSGGIFSVPFHVGFLGGVGPRVMTRTLTPSTVRRWRSVLKSIVRSSGA